MKKQKEKIKVNKLNKNVRYFLWTIFGILMLGGFVFATTNFITEQGITTPNGVFSGNVSVGGNLNVTGIIIPKSEGISSSDLLVYYPLDSNALDYSGNGNDLITLVNTSYSSGRIGNAMNFNINGYARSVTSPSYFPLSGQQTVCLWNKVLASNDGNQEFFFYSSGGTNNRVYLNKELNGKMRYTIGSTSTDFLLPSQYSNNTWNHFCVIRDYNNLRGLAYWNGKLVSNVSVTIGTTGSSIIMLGVNVVIDGSSVNKLIDDVRVYNRSLSSDEIAQIYQSNQELNPTVSSIRAINTVGYIENNGIDIVTQYNNLIANGAKEIIANPATYTTGNTLNLTTSNIHIDFRNIIYQYNGTGDAVQLNAGNLLFDFNKIYVTKTASVGINGITGGNSIITGNILGVSGGNYSTSAIQILGSGENTFNIRNIFGGSTYGSNHAIYYPDVASIAQGNKFISDWIFQFSNSSIQVGDTYDTSNGYIWFDVGMDNCNTTDCLYNVSNFIVDWRGHNTYNIRYMVANAGTHIVMQSSSHDNLIMAGHSSMTYSDLGSGNTWLVNNAKFNSISTSTITGLQSLNVSTIGNWSSSDTLTHGLVEFSGYSECGQASNSTITYDSSRSLNNGNLIGSPTCIEGAVRSSYYLNGSQYISYGSPASFNFTNTNFTISYYMYVNSNVTSTMRYVSKRSGNTGFILQSTVTNPTNITMEFQYGNGTALTPIAANNKILFNQWYHVVGMLKGNTIYLYLNGNLVSTRVVTPYVDSAGTAVTIGGDAANYMIGTVDELRIWNRSLTAQELEALDKGFVTQADAHLNNLLKVSDQNPQTNAIYNLGSSLLRWLKGWFVNIDVSGTANIMNVTINSTGYLIHSANTTSMTCATGTEGAIYYDGSSHLFYGCNGTTWNALG